MLTASLLSCNFSLYRDRDIKKLFLLVHNFFAIGYSVGRQSNCFSLFRREDEVR
jgi:hypothetical protein